jgi:hypothetical protein
LLITELLMEYIQLFKYLLNFLKNDINVPVVDVV